MRLMRNMTWIILHLCWLILFCDCSASPVDVPNEIITANGNRTILKNEPAPRWVPALLFRSSYGIIRFCVLTIILCVYTTVHLNIYDPNPWYALDWIRIRWIMTAIFSPDILLCTACRQFIVAYRLRGELNNSLARAREIPTESGGAFASYFTMVYAIYAAMGGFVVDVRDMHNTVSRLTLTPAGLLALAYQGQYIRLPDKTINDKSKSDVFGKILVCIQALWILVQCITRAIKDLPLTLLELHTLIQACFALIIIFSGSLNH
ncbi:hypothetical protein MFIFM68171_05575 [Madurella fahalii]|uniref:Uncharacterized protein n=1 Tax=Madurella fahalii TaxID=1157608 RepID=A0ABQ0GC88_9PEZI